MTGVKLEISYGVRDSEIPAPDEKLSEAENTKALEQYFDTVERNEKNRRSLTVDVEKDLAPASWNVVEAIISPSRPEDLGRIEVGVRVTGMKLTTPR
jgi:hypothetical protein